MKSDLKCGKRGGLPPEPASLRPFASFLGTIFLFSFGLVLSCGGGTTGTGGTGSTEFNGRILDANGIAVAQALVTLLETGDSTSTAADGSFALNADLETSSATLLVEDSATSASVTLSDISEDVQAVDLELELDRETEALNVKKRTDKRKPASEEDTPTAVPDDTPAPPAEPTPTSSDSTDPTATPIAIPQPTQSGGGIPQAPTPTIADEPTVTPTAAVETPVATNIPEITVVPTRTSAPVAQRSLYRGTIRTSPGSLLRSLKLSVSGSTTVSVGTKGNFSLKTRVLDSSMSLLARTSSGSARTIITGLPNAPILVTLSLSLVGGTQTPAPSPTGSPTPGSSNVKEHTAQSFRAKARAQLRLSIDRITVTRLDGVSTTPTPAQTP